MPTAFCDLNFIVSAHQGLEAYKIHLRQLAEAGTVKFVLSPTHWVEAAEDADSARGDAKADFMDSLRAHWILERRSMQRKEASLAFFRFLNLETNPPQMIGSMVDIIADFTGVRAERNSRNFVARLRTTGPDHLLRRNIQQAFEMNRVNREKFRAGQLNDQFLRDMQKRYILDLLPAHTPRRDRHRRRE